MHTYREEGEEGKDEEEDEEEKIIEYDEADDLADPSKAEAPQTVEEEDTEEVNTAQSVGTGKDTEEAINGAATDSIAPAAEEAPSSIKSRKRHADDEQDAAAAADLISPLDESEGECQKGYFRVCEGRTLIGGALPFKGQNKRPRAE